MDKPKKKLTVEDVLLYGGLFLCSVGSFILGERKHKREMEEAVDEAVDKKFQEMKS